MGMPGGLFVFQMGQYLLDDYRILDAGNFPDRSFAHSLTSMRARRVLSWCSEWAFAGATI
jgi:hypothetical protein